jgi:hypothetical protein
MLIDCDRCPNRATGCPGCLVTTLLDPPAEVRLLEPDELWAIEILSRAGFDVTMLDAPSARAPVRLLSPRGRAA